MHPPDAVQLPFFSQNRTQSLRRFEIPPCPDRFGTFLLLRERALSGLLPQKGLPENREALNIHRLHYPIKLVTPAELLIVSCSACVYIKALKIRLVCTGIILHV